MPIYLSLRPFRASFGMQPCCYSPVQPVSYFIIAVPLHLRSNAQSSLEARRFADSAALLCYLILSFRSPAPGFWSRHCPFGYFLSFHVGRGYPPSYSARIWPLGSGTATPPPWDMPHSLAAAIFPFRVEQVVLWNSHHLTESSSVACFLCAPPAVWPAC